MLQREIFLSHEFEPKWNGITLTQESIVAFQTLIFEFYRYNGRSFPWRETQNPYHIVVSEIMLQQTQTSRVIEKYQAFIKKLPDFASLARIEQRELLRLWQGLGYNRRALYLQKIAQKIMMDYNGNLPEKPSELIAFPGIGQATAASICAFAYDTPTYFIETNIRAVFIYFFFKSRDKVHDDEIMPLVECTLPGNQSRLWYYALMDYGVMLKKKYKNPSTKSIHHNRQNAFIGSDRQIRGAIIKLLLENEKLTSEQIIFFLSANLGCCVSRAKKILNDLVTEQFIKILHDRYFIQ